MVEQLSLVEVDEIAAEIKPPKIEKRTVKEIQCQYGYLKFLHQLFLCLLIL